MQSTDSSWTPLHMQTNVSTAKHQFKLLSVTDFSLYMETPARFLKYESTTEFRQLMSNYVSTKAAISTVDFLLAPVSARVQVSLNQNKMDFNEPQLKMDIVLDQLQISLLKNQFRCALGASDWFATYEKRVEYYKYNAPSKTPTEDPQSWWKFAIRATLDKAKSEKRTWNLQFFKNYREDKANYIPLFKKSFKIGRRKVDGTGERNVPQNSSGK